MRVTSVTPINLQLGHQTLYKKWFGNRAHVQHYGEIFSKARAGKQDVEADLIRLSQDKQQANIVRATAIELLARYNRPKSVKARIEALASENVLLREAAVRALSPLPVKERIAKLAPLLRDPVRAVRIESASILASVSQKQIPDEYKQPFKRALGEYTSLQEVNLDNPGSYYNLGNLYQKQGDSNKAINAYQSSIDLDKSFYPAQLNLATVFNSIGRNVEAKQVLTKGIKHNQEQGELYYSLGLLYAEQSEMDAAVPVLAKAAALLPHNSRIQYNYALALQHQGDFKTAETTLGRAHALNSKDPDILYALAVLHLRQKNWGQAMQFAKALSVLFPESKEIKRLLNHIRAQSN